MRLLEGKGAGKPEEEVTHQLADKTIADVCEASIGVAFMQHNIPGFWNPDNWQNAIAAVTKVVGNNRHTATKWSDYVDGFTMPQYCLAPATWRQINMVKEVSQLDDYTFKHPPLLQSAFTHPSTLGFPSYQRLEFLGDALLDLACVTHMFYRHPWEDPQWLTEHKSAMVANDFLAALCLKLEFNKFMDHNHPSLANDITNYRLENEKLERECDGRPDYWTKVKGKSPKCLSDIVEAYIGAMFIDSGFNYGEVQRFFDTHIAPFFEDLTIFDSYAKDHPITRLVQFLQVDRGCRDFEIHTTEFPVDPGLRKKYISMVMIHDEVIADDLAVSVRYGKPRVASKAMRLIENLRPQDFRKRFGCTCRPDEHEMENGHGDT